MMLFQLNLGTLCCKLIIKMEVLVNYCTHLNSCILILLIPQPATHKKKKKEEGGGGGGGWLGAAWLWLACRACMTCLFVLNNLQSFCEKCLHFLCSTTTSQDSSTEAMFGTMEKTLVLLEMGFSEKEVSTAIEKCGECWLNFIL